MTVCSLLAACRFIGDHQLVGLVHLIMRKFVGNDYRYLVPGSALAGAVLLIWLMWWPVVIAPICRLALNHLGAPMFVLLFKGKS